MISEIVDGATAFRAAYNKRQKGTTTLKEDEKAARKKKEKKEYGLDVVFM